MRRDKESGFALLLVFLMAAVIAISLYSEIPRVAFQSQRHKEQLLLERGQQYIRAIQMYNQATRGGWPQKVEDLETFQNRHFLRHKYVDPMTGKAEWRLIHIQGNVLTDSLLTKKPDDKQDRGTESTYVSAYAGLGETQPGTANSRPQDRRRASEEPTAPGAEGQAPPVSLSPSDPNSQFPSGTPSMPGAPVPVVAAAPGMPGANLPGQAGAPGTNVPDQSQAGAYVSANPGLGVSVPSPGAPSSPGQPFSGAPGQPGQPGYLNPQGSGSAPGPNAALSMINQILTTPNPRAAQIVAQQQPGAPGTPGSGLQGGAGAFGLGGSMPSGSPSASGGGNGVIGGSRVAGVASKMEQEGIMVYNDRTAYNEWEFVFDPAKVPPIPSPNGGGVPGSTPAGQLASPAGQAFPGGQSPMGMGAPTGQMAPQMGPAAGQIGQMGQIGQTGGQMGTGAAGSGAAGSANNPATMQTAGGPAPNLPPDLRPGRP